MSNKMQFFAVLFTDGKIIIHGTKFEKPVDVIGHIKYSGKVSMFYPLGAVKSEKVIRALLNYPKGWVSKFGKPVTTKAAKLALASARTAIFKAEMAASDGARVWKKARVFTVQGLSKSTQKQIKAGQIVKMTFFPMPVWYETLEATDGRDDESAPKVVAVIATKKGNVIVNNFTAQIL